MLRNTSIFWRNFLRRGNLQENLAIIR